MNDLIKKTILLVEDEIFIALREQMEIEAFGYHVLLAHSGEEAIDIFNNNKVDLILMDIDLGEGIDGTETAAIILKDNEVPIVFLSSHTEPEIVGKTEKITSYGYVVKNSSLTVLDASIKMAFKLFEANRATREKERLLLSMAENYPNSHVSIIEADYTVGFSSGQEFKKQNLDSEPFVGMTLEQAFGAQSDIVRERYEKTFKGEECSFEFFFNEQHQYYRTVPLYAEDGGINRILVVVENITERKQAEKRLKESEERFRAFMENSTDASSLYDSNLNLIEVNKVGLGMFPKGTKKEDVIGKNLLEIEPDLEGSGRHKEYLEVLKTGKPLFIDDFVPHPKWGDVHLSVRLFKVGDGLGMIVTDITEIKQSEELAFLHLRDLRRSEEKLQTLLDATTDIAFLAESDGTLLAVNHAVAKSLGEKEENLIGKSVFEFFSGEIAEKRSAMLKTVIETKKPVQWEDERAGRYFEIAIYPILDDNGQVKQVATYAKDFTERKGAEEALEKSLRKNKNLLRELQHRTKNSFLMIDSLIGFMAKDSESGEVKSALTEVGSRVMAVSEMYDLLYSSDSLSEVQLDEYLTRVASALPSVSKRITLKKTCEAITIPVKIAVPIGIIITELITNSIKHAFPDKRGGTITLTLEKIKTGALIKVEDDGIGLPGDLDVSVAKSLGLKIVRALILQIRGSFKIEGVNGTRCSVEVPIKKEASP